MRQRHKKISILLLLAMVIQIFTPFMNNIGYAEGKEVLSEDFVEEVIEDTDEDNENFDEKENIEELEDDKKVDIEKTEKENNEEVIESFTEESSVKNGTEGDELNVTYSNLNIDPKELDNPQSKFDISIDWELTDKNQTVKPGDYFYLDWPDNVKFPTENAIDQINLSGYGRAEKVDNSNKIKFIFNNKVVTEETNIEGELDFNGVELASTVTGEGPTNIDINLGSQQGKIKVNFPTNDETYDPNAPLGRDLGKWGTISDDGTKINWVVDFNGEKGQGKYTFTDSFGPGHYLDEESVSLSYRNANGNYLISEGKVLGDNQSIGVNGSRNTNIEYTKENGKITGFTITGYAFPEDGAYLLYYDTILDTNNIKENKVSNNANYNLNNENKGSQNVEVNLASAWGTARGKKAEVGEVKLIKIDYSDKDKDIKNENLKVLSGVKFKLEKLKDEKDSDANDNIKEGTTDEAGILSFKNLTPGNYTIKEVKFPEGYEKTLYVKDSADNIKEVKNGYKFDLKANEGITILAYNKKEEEKLGKFTLKKVDSEDENKVLEGAKFTLTKKENILEKIIKTLTEEDNAVTKTTGEDGKITFEDLKPGEYILKETKSPKGYELLKEEIIIKVTEDGKVELINSENENYFLKEDILTVKNTREKIELVNIEVNKKWNDSEGNELTETPEEIKVKLYNGNEPVKDSEDKELELTLSDDNNWTDSFKNLPKNDDEGKEIKYTVKEFIKKDEETVEVTETDENKTGYTLKVTGNIEEGFTITNTKVKPEEPTEPGEEDPNKPGEEDPNKPGEEDPNKPGEEDPNKPGEEDPNKPGEEDPNKPGEEDPNKPGEEDPNKPEPTDPEPTEPTDPKPGIPVEPDNPEPTDPEEPEEPEIPEVPEEEEPEEPEEDVGGVIVEPEDPEKPEPELPEEEEEPEVPEEEVGGVIVEPEEEEEPVKPEEDVAGVVVDKVEDKTPTLPKTGENSTIFLILGLVFIMTGIILKRKIFA